MGHIYRTYIFDIYIEHIYGTHIWVREYTEKTGHLRSLIRGGEVPSRDANSDDKGPHARDEIHRPEVAEKQIPVLTGCVLL